MKIKDPQTMTNRELFTRYQTGDKTERYIYLEEMAKRLNCPMVTKEVSKVFS